MSSLNEIRKEIIDLKATEDIVRRKYLKKLYKYTKRDTIIYATTFNPKKNIPGTILITESDICGFMSCLNGLMGKELDIILHSPGGSGDAAEQIVKYLRSKYDHIRAIVPQNAMSAATMIACACDSIVMGRHSSIGPIDPQMIVTTANGFTHNVSAQSVLDEYEMAKNEIKNKPELIHAWSMKIQNYPPGFLIQCYTAIESAKSRAVEWLSNYMLDDFSKAEEIAHWLSDANEHKTHGKPITLDLAKQKGLKIEMLEDDQKLQEIILSLHYATLITFELTNCVKIIENHNGIGSFINII